MRSGHRLKPPRTLAILPLTAIAAGLLLLAACAPSVRPTPNDPTLARRLVLALDGIDYRDIVAARERGLFTQFRAPSRLIGTFPSISDIAWHEIFGVRPPPGYQRTYYSNAQQVVVGEVLDEIRPIEFEQRMDFAFDTKFHHVGAYLISDQVARKEVDIDVRDFFTVTGQRTVYVYNVGPDALQHTRGDLEGYLWHLDRRLRDLAIHYRRQTGSDLEIVVLSDHGHNKVLGAKFVPIEKTLKASGFRIVRQPRSPTEVAFSVDGVTTGFGVFCAREAIPTVAQALADMEGVELVSAQMSDSTFEVMQDSLRGRIDVRRSPQGDRYRYVPLRGDPLGFVSVMARMNTEGATDADGFADTDAWRRYTATTEFPLAVVRIVRGHTQVTLNPAPILVSILSTHRIGLGLASITDRIVSLGGTHGSLSIASSLGMLMTNFQDTHDDLTTTVREQLDGFDDLGAVHIKAAGARLTNAFLITRDERSPFRGMVTGPREPTQADALELWITERQFDSAANGGMFRVELRRMNDKTISDTVVASSDLPLPTAGDETHSSSPNGWMMAPDRRHFLLPIGTLLQAPASPNAAYQVRVTLHRPEGGKQARAESTNLVTLVIRANDRGELWPY